MRYSALLSLLLMMLLITTVTGQKSISGARSIATSAAQTQTKTTRSLVPTDHLEVGGVTLTLGLPFEEVTALLKQYRLSQTETNFYMITSKTGPPYEVIGSLSFTEGRLSYCSKFWGSFSGPEAVAYGRGLLNFLTEQNDRTIKLRVRRLANKNDQKISVDRLEFDAANQSLSISFNSQNQQSTLPDNVSITRHNRAAKIFTLADCRLAANQSKSDLIKQLGDRYLVTEADDNTLIISDWAESKLIGLIYFKNNRLLGISEVLAELESAEAMQFSAVLSDLIRGFQNKNIDQFTVRITTSTEQELKFTELALIAGTRRITFYLLTGNDNERHITVQEDLSLESE